MMTNISNLFIVFFVTLKFFYNFRFHLVYKNQNYILDSIPVIFAENEMFDKPNLQHFLTYNTAKLAQDDVSRLYTAVAFPVENQKYEQPLTFFSLIFMST